MNPKDKFYAYMLLDRQGNVSESGILRSWPECEVRVKGKKAKFKKFHSLEEANAFLEGKSSTSSPSEGICEIYFDCGTGFKEGPEVRLTNPQGENILDKVVPKKYLNSRGHFLLSKEQKTNNFGELLGCFFALSYALKQGNLTKICGDSRLVIDYWSKNHISSKNLNVTQGLKWLCQRTSVLRKEFESKGGQIHLISGDKNQADLGFH